MNTSLFRLFSLLVIVSLMTAGCSYLNPTPNDTLQQQITQTMQAVATNAQATLQAAVPTAAPPTVTPLPTDTPAATSTPLPSDTPNPTEIPNPTEPPAPTDTPVPVVIPINTVAPVPTATLPPEGPTFSLDYYRLETCNSNWIPAIKIVNTGVATLSSYTVVTKDRDNNNTETASGNDFSKRSGCSLVNDITSVEAGKTGYVYAQNFNYDPKGHSVKATVTVCVHNDMKGKCASKSINFTPG